MAALEAPGPSSGSLVPQGPQIEFCGSWWPVPGSTPKNPADEGEGGKHDCPCALYESSHRSGELGQVHPTQHGVAQQDLGPREAGLGITATVGDSEISRTRRGFFWDTGLTGWR